MGNPASDDSTAILKTMVQRLFEDHAPSWERHDAPAWPADTWSAIDEMGLPLALLSEVAGGFGLAAADALSIVGIGAGVAMPLPLGEAMLASWTLAEAGIALPEGAVTIAPSGGTMALIENEARFTVRGVAPRVPFARHVEWVLVPVADRGATTVVLLSTQGAVHTQGENLAGEARDDLAVDVAIDPAWIGRRGEGDPIQWRAHGAILRCQAMAGAAERVMAMTVQYARERIQFGKSLGSFQAIQHNLAVAAGHVVAARGSADMAAAAFGEGDIIPIAVAKARCGEAAGAIATIAHQVHGALGFTQEYALQRYTRRLWAWREEYGAEAEWQMLIGRAAADAPTGLWPFLTRLS
ncbi:MAG: hypothetical protein JWR77_589 [Rhizorhabdus sp.]|nr:hypothetical protein [Rhizorhabdus sp.]